MASPSVIARATASKSLLGPLDVGRLVHQGAGRIPDPIEFVMSDRYLGKASLYPRQGTMIKVLNLREDMFCADEQTQILTRRGWQHYWEVIEGEDVLTLREDGRAEWAPAERVNVFETHDEPLVLMQGEGHSSLTTRNHRWLVERMYQKRSGGHRRETEFVETQHLRATDRIACAAPVLNLPVTPAWDDAFVELAAWYWTEGSALVGSRGGVKIGQSVRVNPLYVDRIRQCLTDLFGPASDSLRATDSPAWREDPAQDDMVYFRLNAAAGEDLRWVAQGEEKVVRPEFIDSLTPEQLTLYIETSIDADGWRTQGKHETARKITQRSRARLESLQMACSLAGYRTVLREAPIRTGKWAGSPCWSLTIHGERRRYFSPQPRQANERRDAFRIEEVRHTGHVWCPTTPNGTWLARRDGKVYFTGNTQYDYDVVGEWEETFRRTGNEGISPGILDRMRINREAGRRWFREALAAIGRRGGKGHVGGLQGAYVTWHYMNVPGGPHHYYGIDPDKRLAAIVFAGKKEQAVAYQWRDLVNAITSSTCFQPFISKNQGERLTLYTPTDLLRLQQQQFEGIRVDKDQASIEIVPSGNTAMAGRGPAAFMEFFDEMAHIVKVGAGSDAKGIYDSATPALDQFGTDGFIFAGSSPWQMMGQFYDLAQLAIEMEDGQPVYPERLLIQLPSWGPYEDWKIAHTIGLAPSKKTYIDVKDSRGRIKVVEQEVVGRTYPVVRFPIQTYDEDMRKLERANPDTFAVERRSHWAASLNAYLNMTKVQAAFKPFRGEPLRMADGGPLSIYYAAHGDPAKVNDNFGFAIAHTVPPTGDEDAQFPHVVVDVVKSWRSEDFDLDEDGVRKIDYTIVQADIERMIEKFKIDHLTFDQFNSVQIIGNLNAFVRKRGFPKRIQVYERTATAGSNWREAEVFKAALNMNLIHIPALDADGNPSRDAELAELEMTFLEEKNGKVAHPSSGPVQTNDVADALMAVTYHLIGEQMGAFLNQALDEASRTMGASGQAGSFGAARPPEPVSQEDPIKRLAEITAASAPRGMDSGAARSRGMRRR